MRCHPKSDYRRLVLLAPALEERYPELVEFARSLDWRVSPEFGAISVELGSTYPLPSVAELVAFLRGVLDRERLAGLNAAWIDEDQPLGEQATKRAAAEPLLSMVDEDSSLLLDILNRRQIETWYQPVFRTGDLQVWGYECLLRGRGNDGALIQPVQLIAWARQENLLYLLDRVCRETHLSNAGAALAGRDCRVLINFTPAAIYNPDFCLKTTVAAAERSGLKPERVVFEVVETDEIEDRGHLQRILDYFRGQGFKVALDDVGSGYSSLALLADMSPDLIKIDRELVAKATNSSLHRDVLSLLVKLGKDNDKLVLAEGIERPDQMELAQRLNIDLVQGYLLGRPAPTPEAAAVATA